MASGLCVPHQQAAHMAAPTEGQSIKITLANGEPSTHGAKRRPEVADANVRFGSIVLKKSFLKAFCRPDSLVLVRGDAGDDGRTDCDAGGAVLRL
jgi:hypothetical protein